MYWLRSVWINRMICGKVALNRTLTAESHVPCKESVTKLVKNPLRNSSRIHSRRCVVPHPWVWTLSLYSCVNIRCGPAVRDPQCGSARPHAPVWMHLYMHISVMSQSTQYSYRAFNMHSDDIKNSRLWVKKNMLYEYENWVNFMVI